MTFRKSAAGTAFLIGASIPTPVQATEVCHIANAGFYFEHKGVGVLVDAIMERDDYDGSFALPTAPLLATMTNGEGKFQNVKLALATHKHGDHFDAVASLRHLRATNVHYAVTPEIFDMLRDEGMTDVESHRVSPFLPEWGQGPTKYSGDGFELEIYRIDHGPDMPQNLGYRVVIGHKSFFHTGDINASPERLADAGLDKLPVDYMMMPFWYILQQKADAKTAWDITTMIPTHYHAKEQPWMARFGGAEGLREATKTEWPGSIRLDQEMQCQSFD